MPAPAEVRIAEDRGRPLRFRALQTTRIRPSCLLVGLACSGVLALVVGGGAVERRSKPNRAKPPTFSQDVRDIFFPDLKLAFEGERPDYAALLARVGSTAASSGREHEPVVRSSQFTWSKIIRAETLENEIKRAAQRIGPLVASSTSFKGGSYRDCRTEFSTLAILFGIIAEYDQDVRWRESAPVMRDRLARAGFNCKVGTDASFKEAKLRHQDLQDLVRGSRLDASGANSERPAWPQLANRPPLMRRIEAAYDANVEAHLGAAGEFRSHADDIRHEAELLAALAEAITDPGYEFADDDAYAEFVEDLGRSSAELAKAAAEKNYATALDASTALGDSCIDCHDGFR